MHSMSVWFGSKGCWGCVQSGCRGFVIWVSWGGVLVEHVTVWRVLVRAQQAHAKCLEFYPTSQ